jgi:hypothetical protein
MAKNAIPQVKFVNVETGEEIIRDATTEEIEEMEKVKEYGEELKKATAQKAADKAALLERLGITAEEAQLLLGGN